MAKRKRKVKTVKAELKRSRYTPSEIIALIRFLMVLLQSTSGKTGLTKAQRKSLAITESQLGVRRKTARAGKSRKARSGGKKKRRKGGKTAHQRRFAALARKHHGRIPKGTKI